MSDLDLPPDRYSDAEEPRRGSRTKWILGCGCGGFLILIALAAFAVKSFFDGVFPDAPLDFPVAEAPADVVDELKARSRSSAEQPGERIRFTPEEVSILAQAGLNDRIAQGQFGPESKIRCQLAGPNDDRLRVLASIQMPDDASWIGGRFFNLTLTGHIVVRAGEVAEIEIDDYQIGTYVVGESLDQQQSREALKTIQDQMRGDVNTDEIIQKIELLRVHDGQIELELR